MSTSGGNTLTVFYERIAAVQSGGIIGLLKTIGIRFRTPTSPTQPPTPSSLTVPAPTVTPNPGTVGSPVSFSVSPSGGTAPYSYAWHFYVNGIPAPGDVDSFSGSPTSRGTWAIYVRVTDSTGTEVTSPTTTLVVNP